MNQNRRRVQGSSSKSTAPFTPTLAQQSDHRETASKSKGRSTLAAWMVNIGILISAALTIIYLMLLVEGAVYLPSPWGLIFGLLVGTVAIIPAEMALFVWEIRLRSDRSITDGQRRVSVVAMVLAGVFSALTTSSFFSYFLPGLFPQSYMALAPTLNVGAIVGSWIVFIMSVVAYGINSRETKQNIAEARAHQSIFDARMTILSSGAEAIRIEADGLVEEMHQAGFFRRDATALITSHLGLDAARVDNVADNGDEANAYVAHHNGFEWIRDGAYRPLADARAALPTFAASDPDMEWAVIQNGRIMYEYEASPSPNGPSPSTS